MNPRMITLARESRGLSQTELSRLASIPQGTLSKAENGLADLSEERLQAVADALDYPRTLFDWPDPVFGFGSSIFHHRKLQSLSQTVLRRAQALVNLVAGRLTRLVRGIDITPSYTIPTYDPEHMSPQQAAQAVRAAWRLPMGPIDNMVRTAEAAGAFVIRRDFGSPKMPGISVRTPDGSVLIVLNVGMPADRERFTIAHELGHLVLHDAPRLNGEEEADEFASEFLMPALEIKSQLSRIDLAKAAMLKRHWKTAMSALIRRARDLGVITEGRYKSLMVQMSQQGIRRVEPVELPREEPSIVPAVIEIHLTEHGYTRQELADTVCLRLREFEDEFELGPVQAHERPARRLHVVR